MPRGVDESGRMYGEIGRMNNVAAPVIVCLASTRAKLVETPELLKVEWIQTRSGDSLTTPTSHGAIKG